MNRALITSLTLLLALFIFLPQPSLEAASSFPLIGIRTFVGSSNIHVRGFDCYGCHQAMTPGRPPQTVKHSEPCHLCHEQATREEIRWAETCDAPICPVLINYHQPDGGMIRFFFGNRSN